MRKFRFWSVCQCAAIALVAPSMLFAQPSPAPAKPAVTYSRDIAPILQRSCTQCHRQDGGAPMSLQTYAQVRPWARAIKSKTGLRGKRGTMPPWFIDRAIGIQSFQDDMSLSDEEIDTIARWVDSGSPQGDPADMPRPQVFQEEGWAFEPDLIVRTPDFTLEPLAPDRQISLPSVGRNGRIPTGLMEDRWVAAVQVREINDVPPNYKGETVGSRFVVHHVTYTTEAPGGIRDGISSWPVHEVGRGGDVFPADAVRKLHAGAEIVSDSVHVSSNGRKTTAHLEFAFKFHPKNYVPKYPVLRVTRHGNGMEHDIRAGEPDNQLTSSWVLQDHTKLLSFEPHLHAAGRRMCLEASWGNITETITCADYDHNWVRNYWYGPNAAPLLPKGTILKVTGWMDNSKANPNVVDSRNWQGPGNLSRENMFHLFATWVPMTDEQFVKEVRARKEAIQLKSDQWIVGCVLCLAIVPPPAAKPADVAPDVAAKLLEEIARPTPGSEISRQSGAR